MCELDRRPAERTYAPCVHDLKKPLFAREPHSHLHEQNNLHLLLMPWKKFASLVENSLCLHLFRKITFEKKSIKIAFARFNRNSCIASYDIICGVGKIIIELFETYWWPGGKSFHQVKSEFKGHGILLVDVRLNKIQFNIFNLLSHIFCTWEYEKNRKWKWRQWQLYLSFYTREVPAVKV